MYSINSLLEYFLVVVQFVMNFDLSLFIYLFINKKKLNYRNPSHFHVSCQMMQLSHAVFKCIMQMTISHNNQCDFVTR